MATPRLVVMVVVVLALVLGAESLRLDSRTAGKMNKPISEAARRKRSELFELLKSKDWMSELTRQISERKQATSSKRPTDPNTLTDSEVLLEAARQLQGILSDEYEENRPSHRSASKFSGRGFRRNMYGSAMDEQVLRAKRSVSESEPNGRHGASDEPQRTSSEATPVTMETTSSGNKPQTHNLTFPACPAQFAYCVYGDCVDLGHAVYVCNCQDGYTGMSCEILDLQTSVVNMYQIAGSESPEMEAYSNFGVYSSVTAVAQYLAGDIPDYQ